MKVLEVKEVSKSFGRKKVLNNISLELGRGKVLGILAPNGAGKSTLLNIIAGLLNESGGKVLIDGEEKSFESKGKVSYLHEKNILPKGMKIKEAKEFYKDFFEGFDEKKFNELLKFMNLEENMRVKTLSKGMLEKLNLSLTLSRKASLYILDEPISGVDPVAREKIIDAIIDNIQEDASTIITTHYVGELDKLFDEVCFIGDGAVIEYGNADDLRDKYNASIDEIYRKIFGGYN
ncbi:MAG: ABC transporter ATP-binding protein [Clostridium sp.]